MRRFELVNEDHSIIYLNYYPDLDKARIWGSYQWYPYRTEHSIAEFSGEKGIIEYTKEDIEKWKSLNKKKTNGKNLTG